MRSQKSTRRNLVDSKEFLRVYFLLILRGNDESLRKERNCFIRNLVKVEVVCYNVSFRCLIVSRIRESERDAKRGQSISVYAFNCRNMLVMFFNRSCRFPLYTFLLFCPLDYGIFHWNHRFPLITLYHALRYSRTRTSSV